MSWSCPCGASVGTQDHWCEALQSRHAERVERLLALIAAGVAALNGQNPTSQSVGEIMRLTKERREDFRS